MITVSNLEPISEEYEIQFKLRNPPFSIAAYIQCDSYDKDGKIFDESVWAWVTIYSERCENDPKIVDFGDKDDDEATLAITYQVCSDIPSTGGIAISAPFKS